MTRQEKAEIIEDLAHKFKEKPFFYIVDGAGLTVADTNKFRKSCFDQGIEYKIVKNTLIQKALESLEEDYTELIDSSLKGFSGILFHPESGSAPAKLLKKFNKEVKDKPELKAASIDASFFIGANKLEELTKIKSKEDLLAELVALLQSPGANLAALLKGPGQKLAGALQSTGNNLSGALKSLEESKK